MIQEEVKGSTGEFNAHIYFPSSTLFEAETFNELENSSTEGKGDEPIAIIAKDLFNVSEEIIFEDGIENEFSRNLISFINQFKAQGMEEIIKLILYEIENEAIVGETLRWLGASCDSDTHFHRKWLLERCLYSRSLFKRDAALIGLSYLNDPRSVSSLKKALGNESSIELKEDIERLIKIFESGIV